MDKQTSPEKQPYSQTIKQLDVKFKINTRAMIGLPLSMALVYNKVSVQLNHGAQKGAKTC